MSWPLIISSSSRLFFARFRRWSGDREGAREVERGSRIKEERESQEFKFTVNKLAMKV